MKANKAKATTKGNKNVETKKATSIMKWAVYYCATSFGNWGKGYTIEAAKKAAKAQSRTKGFIVWACLFEEPATEEEKKEPSRVYYSKRFQRQP